ncbi:hypothetical protein Tco_0127290 [Tanacetum coccineum]
MLYNSACYDRSLKFASISPDDRRVSTQSGRCANDQSHEALLSQSAAMKSDLLRCTGVDVLNEVLLQL